MLFFIYDFIGQQLLIDLISYFSKQNIEKIFVWGRRYYKIIPDEAKS